MVAPDHLLLRPHWPVASRRQYAGSLSGRAAYRANVGTRAVSVDLCAIGMGGQLSGSDGQSGRLTSGSVRRPVWDLRGPGIVDNPLSQHLAAPAPIRLVSGHGHQL